MQRIIGIDFGTSTTYMNVKRYNGAQPVEDKFSYMPVVFNYGESSGFVASIARENGDGSFDFGEKAAEPLEGARVYTEVKMRLESPDEGERIEARRITREFFKFLYQTYAQQSGNLGSPDDTEEAVISYPVKWKEETSQFMLEAARGAGFQNVWGMDEAEAAMAAVLCQNSEALISRDKPGYLLLIDMGAGTTDLVVCRYQPRTDSGGLQVDLVTSWPQSADEPTFGGREIDAALENYVERYLSGALNPALAPQARIIATAPGQAKAWKERNVSVTLAADKPVTTCAYTSTYKAMGMLTGDFPAFGRKEFETLIDSGLHDYASLLMGCLTRASALDERLAASGLDLVILTGGHSAWYFARGIVDGTMPGYLDHPLLENLRRDKSRIINLPTPQTTVSLGLVYSKLPYKLAKSKNTTELKQQPRDTTEQKEEKQTQGPTLESEEFFLAGQRCEATGWQIGQAVAHYRAAAELGHAGAQYKMGTLYQSGIGVAQDPETAILWYSKAADQGYERAQKRLDEMLRPSQAEREVPPKPQGTPSQTGDRLYRWDDRLLPLVEKFIRNSQGFEKSNEVYQEAIREPMRKNIGVPAWEDIYYVNTDTLFSSNKKSGLIICQSGLYYRWGLGFGNFYMTWAEFINCVITSKKDGAENIHRGSEWIIAFHVSGAATKLQEFLRDKSIDLEKGRPI